MDYLSERVTIISIGVYHYEDDKLPRLHGIETDLQNIKSLLIENPLISLFKEKQLIELLNPSSAQIRAKLNEYIMSRSADGDILVFYFAGHGVAVGRNDFGFCATDTIIHPLSSVVLPSSVFRFSELLSSLFIANIIPVIIIDACYSGIAGKSLNIPTIEAISAMQEQLHNYSASSYAILCSCAENQLSRESFEGGFFSNLIYSIASEGIDDKDKQSLTLFELSPLLSERMLGASVDMTPRMYLGHTLPQFPLCKNIQYTPQTYTLSSHLVNVVKALWNDGNQKTLTPKEIDKLCGKGAYGNHKKLSLSPWDLVENVPNDGKKRRLTQRGIEFMQGEIGVPRSITQDPKTGEWVPTEETDYISKLDIAP
jgi:hypothetical protein